MKPLAVATTDDEMIAFVDGWAALLEREDYDAAFSYTDHVSEMGWTPDLVRQVIKAYDEASPEQHVTLDGLPTDITQRKEVTWWSRQRGEVWYDLNIDGWASDLTAMFEIARTCDGIVLRLNDIHVM